eukprot:3990486-Pleurochrysis_carterae.AAC.1
MGRSTPPLPPPRSERRAACRPAPPWPPPHPPTRAVPLSRPTALPAPVRRRTPPEAPASSAFYPLTASPQTPATRPMRGPRQPARGSHPGLPRRAPRPPPPPPVPTYSTATRPSRAATTEAGTAPSPGSMPVYFELEKTAAHAASPKSSSATSRATACTPSGCGGRAASLAITAAGPSAASEPPPLWRVYPPPPSWTSGPPASPWPPAPPCPPRRGAAVPRASRRPRRPARSLPPAAPPAPPALALRSTCTTLCAAAGHPSGACAHQIARVPPARASNSRQSATADSAA